MRRSSIALALALTALVPSAGRAEDPPVFLLKWGSIGSGPGQFDTPDGLGIDPSGRVYVTDAGNNVVEVFDGDGAFVGQFGGPGTGRGRFNNPVDIAIDKAGTMYVSDAYNHIIQVFDSGQHFVRQWPAVAGSWIGLDPAGTFLCTTALDTVYVYRTSDGAEIARWQYTVSFPAPITDGFAVGPGGSIYLPAFFEGKVKRFAQDGTLLGAWGDPGTGPGQFTRTSAVAVDADEKVYVITDGCRVQKFTSAGTFLTEWGNCGSGDGQFGLTPDIAFDTSGHIFVLDAGNYRVQKFGDVPTATKRSTWGSLKRRFRP